jgi:hypothetical protein
MFIQRKIGLHQNKNHFVINKIFNKNLFPHLRNKERTKNT